MFCQYCGSPIADDARFCPSCGKPVAGDSTVQGGQGTTAAQGGQVPPADYGQQAGAAATGAQPGGYAASGPSGAAQYQQGASGASPTPPLSYNNQQVGQQPGYPAAQQYPGQGQPQPSQGYPAPAQKRPVNPVLIVVIVAVVVVLCVVIASALGLFSPNKGGGAPAASKTASATASAPTAPSASGTAGGAGATSSPSAPSAPSASSSAGATQSEKEAAIAQGYQVFEGTLHVYTSKEIAAQKGVDPSALPDGEVAVLVFDAPIQVSGMSSDGSGSRRESASMLGVAERTKAGSDVIAKGDLDSWRAYEGKHMTLGAKADQIWFPSDVSLPVGEPRTQDVIIIG